MLVEVEEDPVDELELDDDPELEVLDVPDELDDVGRVALELELLLVEDVLLELCVALV
ncbi:hypothetical protein NRIC_32840 [Enterococcus florum]|uniref:Uncharacterized protein n=1 Tax=Enterococcus florum TaxID=2480627 RepID=A0A4P5PRJ6_9ENTE|nr:hypothetical protein NRIC_32840 [Enterococcus florum]